MDIDPLIEAYYAEHSDENERLLDGVGWIEFARTQELIRRHLPDGALRIVDVGGAAGIHAEWLAADGHNVHLIDPMPRHVDQARELANGLAHPFTAAIGDARALDAADESFDIVLLLGPLYHLTERGDRVGALAEAHRVLRPGGLCFAAAISRFASLFDGLTNGDLADPVFHGIVQQDLQDGQHRNPRAGARWFTTAYFHHPHELEDEAREAGLAVEGFFGVEGMAGWQLGSNPLWDDPKHLELLIESARATESEPSLRGLSAHMLLVARKPSEDDETPRRS